MSIKLTPLEKKLIYNHLPLQLGEREKWAKKVEDVDSIGKRVELARMLCQIVEKKLGWGLQGVAEKPDALKRLETLYTIACLPENILLKNEDVRGIMESPEHEKLLGEKLNEFLKKIIPNLTKIVEENALRNTEYLSNLFEYHENYKSDSNHLELFQMIHKAFLEGGVNEVKKLKYHDKHFQHALKDEKIRGFAEKLDELLGEVTASGAYGGKFDLHEVFKGKLEDFERHAKEEKIDEALARAEKKVQESAEKLKNALKEFNDAELSKQVENLLKKRDFEGLRGVAGNLTKTKFTGKKERIRNLVIGALNAITSLGDQEKLREAVNAGKKIAERFGKLEGKSLREQYETLSSIEREFGRGKLEEHAKTLAALGKASYQDLSFFIKQVLEPPQKPSGGIVKARIIHDPSLLFTLKKFENNCMSPGTRQSQSLLGFTIHPNELTIGFFDEDGEFVGFSFAHFLEHENGHALAIERPYSNHGGLKPVMGTLTQEIAEKINELARDRGLQLTAFRSHEKPSGLIGLKVLPSPYVKKYYDIKRGSVSGGEAI